MLSGGRRHRYVVCSVCSFEQKNVVKSQWRSMQFRGVVCNSVLQSGRGREFVGPPMSTSAVLPSDSVYCRGRPHSTTQPAYTRNAYLSSYYQKSSVCRLSLTSPARQISCLWLDKRLTRGIGNLYRPSSSSETHRGKNACGLSNIRAGFKNKIKKAVQDLEVSLQEGPLPELQDELPQLAISLPLGLASFEGLFMIGWVSSLRGLLPGARAFFSAGDLILCSIMFANCVIGWYALEHSRSEINALPRMNWWSKLKAAKPGVAEIGSSLVASFIPFGNLFLWLRFAGQQEHLSPRAKAAIVANAWVYGGPPLFTILLLLNGGWSVFFQIGLVSNFALLLGALHRPFEEARIKNEKILMEVARAKRIGGKKEKDQNEINAEEKERIERLKELEEFDMLLAQSTPGVNADLSGRPKEWSVGDTMQWLADQGLARYATIFADNNIDGVLLLQLTGDDLRDELGIQSLGDRRKLELLIKQLQKDGYR